MPCWIVFFKEDFPSQNSLGREGRETVSDILVVRVNVQLSTKQHGSELLESFNNRQEFFFNCSIVLLGRVEFARVKGDRLILLFNNSTQLEIRCIGLDVKWEIMIRIDQKSV